MAFNIVAGVNNAVYGSVSGSGSYVEGAEVTLKVTANDGYRFVSWDDGNTDNPRIFNASEDVTLVATLEIIPEYTISVTVNDNSLGTVSGSGTFREGSSTQISATPYVHSRFVSWEDGNSDNPRTITVSAATTYKAMFEAVNYFTISTTVNDANLGSVTGAGEYDEGDTVTLTAVPETDCRFVSWNDGNTDNPRTFTASANITYTATFVEIQYTDVTIASNDVSYGTVSGATSGNIETGTIITLTATPATDYKFDGWQVDGEIVSTSLTASFPVAGQEMDIIAVFSAIVFYQITLITNDVDCGSISVVSATAEPRGEAHNIWPDGTIINLQAVTTQGGKFLNWSTGQVATEITVNVHGNETIRANFYPATGLILVTKKILQQTWSTIKSFFSAPTGASKIGAPANNALGATTLADVVNSVGQANGLAQLNADGKVDISSLGGSSAEGLDVNITGNAATATSASSADVAVKVGTTTVGSSTEPIYINAGTPTACGGSLAVDITGNAATASKLGTTTVGNSALPIFLNNGAPTACNRFAYAQINGTDATPTPSGWFRIFDISSAYDTGLIFAMSAGWGNGAPDSAIIGYNVCNNRPHLYIISSGCNDIGNSITKIRLTCASGHAYVEAYIGSTSQNRNQCFRIFSTVAGVTGYTIAAGTSPDGSEASYTASVDINVKTTPVRHTMETAIGSATVPTYVDADGLSQPCTSISLNADTATTASACSGNAATASVASKVAYTQTTYNGNRPLAISHVEGITNTANFNNAILFSNKVYFHPANGTLTSTGTSGTSSVDGKPAFESALTSATFKSAYNGGVIINSTAAKGFTMLARMKSTNGKFMHGVYNADYQFYYVADTVTNNSVTKTCLTINESGTVSAPNGFSGALTGNVTGNVTGDVTGNCSGSSGSCTGNAATATTATNANNAKLTHTVGNTEYPLVFGSSFVITDAQQALRIGTPSATANQCPLRVKAYCADADTQGEAYLVLGNALAKATANNARGGLVMYGTGTAYNFIKMNTVSTNGKTIFLNTANTADITLTLPSATGTLALTSSDITGNAATATTASACSGNSATATTATNANKIKTTNADGAWKDIIGVDTGFTSASNYAPYGHSSGSVSFYVDKNATSGNQRSILRLGNATVNTTAAGHSGQIWMYGTNTGYTAIVPGYNSTSSVSLTLPSSSGTIALTSSDITGSSASCTGNAATATTASACSGNAASSTYATNIRVTSTQNNNYYYAVGTSGNTASTNYGPAVFPNIVIRDDTNSTSEVFSRLRLGNSTAKGTSGGKTGCLTLYGNNTKLCNLLGPEGASADFNVRLPNSAGTLALTSSDITGNAATATTAAACSGDCAGNAATATTASACSGNAATATYATNARVTKTSNTTWYDLVFAAHHNSTTTTSQVLRVPVSGVASTDDNLNVSSLAVRIGSNASSSGTTVNTDLQIGNSIANNAADTSGSGDSAITVAGRYKYNRRGRILMYGTNTGLTTIVPGNNSTSNATLTLPSSTGTVALTSDIPSQADYVIAQSFSYGTVYVSGYRKWNSGLLEKWGQAYTATQTQDYAVTFDTTVAFTAIPTVFVTKAHQYNQDIYTTNTFYGAYISVFVPHNVTKTGFKIYLSRGSSYNDLNQLQYHAIGKWN